MNRLESGSQVGHHEQVKKFKPGADGNKTNQPAVKAAGRQALYARGDRGFHEALLGSIDKVSAAAHHRFPDQHLVP
jgi:hypothetical protein